MRDIFLRVINRMLRSLIILTYSLRNTKTETGRRVVRCECRARERCKSLTLWTGGAGGDDRRQGGVAEVVG